MTGALKIATANLRGSRSKGSTMTPVSSDGLPLGICPAGCDRSGRNTRLIHCAMGSTEGLRQVLDKVSERPRYSRGSGHENIIMPFTA